MTIDFLMSIGKTAGVPQWRDHPEKDPKTQKWAENIVELRFRLGWSQQKLADEIGANQSSVSQWEQAYYRPTFYYMRRIVALDPTHPQVEEMFPDEVKP